ncbi:MAG: gliding motility-associated ABC transporter substrate-binding protein GldG [Ferruginibacter sp.]|nr:gliding motility-associated ABC transporter substrate-binding protein GldG [Chitinophagaceae bacterium]MBP6287080.1 gliding motility-associated ABC transporter substrate-binding protein GldG [Ferruginibacter sp.]MBU9937024.1 gliding motility-associated ABC transporter substrate-binding protein GldG [Ferruginibacter sp.]
MGLFNKIWNSRLWLPITIIGLVVVNWLASLYHTRVDLTNEKRFTLSSATKKLLKKLDDEVKVDVFMKGDFPSGFKKLANSTGEVLQEFKELAGKKIQYRFISPEENVEGTDVKWADTLSAMGFYPINLTSQVKSGQQQQNIYPVAFVHYKEQVSPVILYQGRTKAITYPEINSAEALMEFNFANAIDRLTRTEKAMIVYSAGNGEPVDARTYDLSENVLKADYKFQPVDMNAIPGIPASVQLLMIVKPAKPFSDETKLKIDQFVMRGGKLLLFVDKLEAELDSLQSKKGEVVAYDRGLELNDMLFKYGVRINSDLVMDLQCDFLPFDVNGNGQFELLPWNYFPVFESRSNHIINKNLGFVSGRFVNSVDTVEAEGIRKTVLLSSSANARSIATPALISVKENSDAPENERFKRSNIPVAMLLEGKFRSLFSNRLSQAMRDSLQKYGGTFMPQCIADNKIIVVADGDIVLNSVIKGNQPIPMGMNPYTFGSQREFAFANRDFLQNCLDYLVNPSGLSEAKAKDYTLRLLDKKKTDAGKMNWQLINIAAPVLLVILFAVLYQFLRKRKYTPDR